MEPDGPDEPGGPDPSASVTGTRFSSDRRFAVHGEVAMLVVTIVFALSFLFLLLRLYLRRHLKTPAGGYDSEAGSGSDGFKGRTDTQSPFVKPPG
ncbi:hypothetical protein H6P81_006457 [Aristolochia fimbriata]|uniref:Uncharacterized protein n=1 Tax=Aristolochia fimbriata TaxID=158543 RepID=A0AAV7EXT4_ARIFI|nr:hypothetical protein H6P81_006457 [Aristolochia fimbriata]